MLVTKFAGESLHKWSESTLKLLSDPRIFDRLMSTVDLFHEVNIAYGLSAE
jgi:hypothetical protein